MKRIVATFTACAALALASQAAAESYVSHSTTVSTAGVDFSNSADVDALHAKLKVSARKMCRGDTSILKTQADARTCRDAALSAAMEKVSQSQLAARQGARLASLSR